MTATKFNIGQKLWPLIRLDGKVHVGWPFACTTISLSGQDTVYGGDDARTFPEIDCFPSLKEAERERAKRNTRPRKAKKTAEKSL